MSALTHEQYEQFLANNFRPTWAEVEKLSAAEDEPEEPFKSKYKANELLTKLKADLQPYSSVEEKDVLDYIAMIDMKLGVNHINTEDNFNGEKHLSLSLQQFIKDKEKHTAQIIEILNNFGILWFARDDPEKAESFLREAEALYKEIREKRPLTDKKQREDKTEQQIERVHTLTLFYLAQVFGAKGNTNQSAEYCHLTLKRQYESKEFDPREFALHCMSISEFYTMEHRYKQALYCLRAAQTIIPPDAGEQLVADLAFGWGRFLMLFLNYQVHLREKERVARRADKEAKGLELTEEDVLTEHYANTKYSLSLEDLSEIKETDIIYFEGLKMDEEHFIVPSLAPVSKIEEAKPYFDTAVNWFNAAKDYYILEGFVTEHIGILQDMNSLYLAYSYFQRDLKQKRKLHKQRLRLLEPLLKELNPNVFLTTVQQILFTCAEIHEAILNLRLKTLKHSKPTKEETQKINLNGYFAITYFQKFATMCQQVKNNNPASKQTPSPEDIPVDADLLEPFLHAHFNMARLYQKLVTDDPRGTVMNLKKALAEYTFINAFAKTHTVQVLQQEISLCGQMLELLPAKIEQYQRLLNAAAAQRK